MKVHEQGNALIDALSEQYSAEDLPGALGDVLTQMLARAIEKGAAGFDLWEAVHDAVDQWYAQLSDDEDDEDGDSWSEDNEAAVKFEEALYGDDPFGAASSGDS